MTTSPKNSKANFIPAKGQTPKGKILAIGGKENKGADQAEGKDKNINFISEQILKRFVQELRGDDPTVVIIPTASNEPAASAQDYIKLFKELGVNKVLVMDIRTREDAFKPEFLKMVEKGDGFMFTGGDQLRLTAIYGGTQILNKLKERYVLENIIIAGTSAGAAAMSTPMIYEGESDGGYIKGDVRMTTGLEFIKNVAIDTHFLTRGRIVRMTQAIATNPECIGIGLEEDTAILVVDGGHIEVVGSGLITIVDGMDMTETNIFEIENGQPFTAKGLRVHLLGDKDEYEIPTYQRVQIV
ncbi:cyanophycinase [Nibribacter ruber]|uniref:Cyanophycinase n=1 Tax=Nibribacter ruber TaxID=2698458 RepID=A0A6P1NUE3_9BACT|nr:cyanophycinase [Nibribacter ruber]QHL87357.1 cyanophycinase [Nibribacter ruber]